MANDVGIHHKTQFSKKCLIIFLQVSSLYYQQKAVSSYNQLQLTLSESILAIEQITYFIYIFTVQHSVHYHK